MNRPRDTGGLSSLPDRTSFCFRPAGFAGFRGMALRFWFVLALFPALAAGRGSLVSGPMLGYQAHRETLIWLETRDARTVSIEYEIEGKPATTKILTVVTPPATPAGVQPVKFVLPLLEMGQRFTYRLMVDGKRQSFTYPLTFATTDQWEWRKPAPDFSFLFGSCAYLNDAPYDRPGSPYGKTLETFRLMAESGAQFMVWGGDNLYLREADFSSESGIWYRYSHDRATPELQKLFASMHHYATWDDHDYGSNDANRSFEFKETSLAAFKAYWGNATWGEADQAGVYGKFFWGDAAFILLDNRYHRDDTLLDQNRHPRKSQYGARQMDWLKQSLLQTKVLGHYPFTFVVTGGQVITSFGGASETFDYFRHEREELLRFIEEHRIQGVIFLSGDVHFTELARKKVGATQWIYELTASPLSSGVYTKAEAERPSDPQRVDGTLVVDQNFTQLSLSGPRGQRVLTVRCIDKTGTPRWRHDIQEAELR
jgi:alkaline phosphatase D